MRFPLTQYNHSLPLSPAPGAFGAIRKFDVHTGVDLYAPVNAVVVAIEAGVVLRRFWFTGSEAGSPWWYPTEGVLIKSGDRYWLYGEINPDVCVGETIAEGQILGKVIQVLKKDKGRPMSMLHLELYKEAVVDGVWWKLGDPQPPHLLDPTPWLQACQK